MAHTPEARGSIVQSDVLNSPERLTPGIRVVINGQGEGAALLFDKVSESGHEVVGVITTVKKTKDGSHDPLRQKAIDSKIPIVNIGDINVNNKLLSEEKYNAANQKLKDMNAHISVGFYLQATMSDETLSIPEFGSINTHYSYLPENAGRDSMNRDVLEGKDIGISVYMMNQIIDGGDIIDQTTFPNPGDQSQGALYYQHLEGFVNFVAKSVDKMAIGIDEYRKNGTPLPLVPQDFSKRTYFDPLTPEDLQVDFKSMDADRINRTMNAGGPGSTVLIDGVLEKIAKPTVYPGPSFIPGREITAIDTSVTMFETTQGIIGIGRRQKTTS
ncbi:MAG TPA: formyltransferase family protein [Candidatus Levybacteria bacterium]|nr:formyltransferase family protein [Candidatus Levybacteria bacterium]